MANRRPLRGAFLIPPPQGAVTDFGLDSDKAAIVDRFLASIDQFPFIEGGNRVYFLYRGPEWIIYLQHLVICPRTRPAISWDRLSTIEQAVCFRI